MSTEGPGLAHLDSEGAARMVDVGGKEVTSRVAVARSVVDMPDEVAELVMSGGLPKGDAAAVARLAGIMAAKKTADLVPLCHPIPIDGVEVELTRNGRGIAIDATVRTTARTGVEMEAMTAASVASLALYDMVKGANRSVSITSVELLSKSGGRSGHWEREKER